jgi:hypothetical protein
VEDCFQSSPNRVTNTQFRNKILGNTFPFPPISRLGEAQTAPSPPRTIPAVLPPGVPDGHGSGEGAEAGGGVSAGSRTQMSCRAQQPRTASPNPHVQPRNSRALPGPGPGPSPGPGKAVPSYLTSHPRTFQLASGRRSHTPQQTNTPHSPPPRSFPNSEETPPPKFKPSAH